MKLRQKIFVEMYRRVETPELLPWHRDAPALLRAAAERCDGRSLYLPSASIGFRLTADTLCGSARSSRHQGLYRDFHPASRVPVRYCSPVHSAKLCGCGLMPDATKNRPPRGWSGLQVLQRAVDSADPAAKAKPAKRHCAEQCQHNARRLGHAGEVHLLITGSPGLAIINAELDEDIEEAVNVIQPW